MINRQTKNRTLINIYYTLTDLATKKLTTLGYRQLKRRVKILSESGVDTRLLYKEKNIWYIHTSIVDAFKSRYNVKAHLQTEVSINMASNYDRKFYEYIAQQISIAQPHRKVVYTVEKSKFSDKVHLHLLTSSTVDEVTGIIKDFQRKTRTQILENPNTNIAPIRNEHLTMSYIGKQGAPVLLNCA